MIEPEAAELLESPCAMIVGTVDCRRPARCDPRLGPRGHRARARSGCCCRRAPRRRSRTWRTTGAFALTVTHFTTFVSYQLKGHALRVEPATAGGSHPLRHVLRRVRRTRSTRLDGTPEELIWRLLPPGIVACIVTVDSVFDQTPGPAAGRQARARWRRAHERRGASTASRSPTSRRASRASCPRRSRPRRPTAPPTSRTSHACT